MSIILDALKKAEKEKNAKNTPAKWEGTPQVVESPHKKTPLSTYILLGVALLSTLFLLFMRWRHGRQTTFIPQPIVALTSSSSPAPDSPAGLEQQARQSFEQGRFGEARTSWENLALLESTRADVYNNLGLTLKKMGDRKGALDSYQKAVLLNPDFAEVHNNLGVLLLGDRQWDEARAHLEKAVALDNNYADAYFNLAVVLEQLRDMKGSGEAFRKFLALSPRVDPALKSQVEKHLEPNR